MTDKIKSLSDFWIRRCSDLTDENDKLKAREKKLIEGYRLECAFDVGASSVGTIVQHRDDCRKCEVIKELVNNE
jgi:hypothetical protein